MCNECYMLFFSTSALLIYFFLNIKLLSSDFYFNGIGLVLTKQCHFIENSILNSLPDVVTITVYPLNS
jgi:hypothetical protein